jgi:starch synthase
MKKSKGAKILFAVSEAVPFFATGGMGQVAGALTEALTESAPEADIRVIMPLYADFRGRYEDSMKFIGETTVFLAWRQQYCGVFELDRNGVKYYFVDNRRYFDREDAYGYLDDGERFAYFSKAVFAVIELTGFSPDVIHAHDWHTALVPVYIRTRFAGKFGHIKTVFTIHNLEYQGKFAVNLLSDVFDLFPEELGIVEYDGSINLMKGAVVCADKLTTVSPSYSQEIQMGGGFGLDKIIRENAYKLSGILNGIDTALYNPATDTLIEKNYSADTLEDKLANKTKLQSLFGLPHAPDKMLICVVSRLAAHKGSQRFPRTLPPCTEFARAFVLVAVIHKAARMEPPAGEG